MSGDEIKWDSELIDSKKGEVIEQKKKENSSLPKMIEPKILNLKEPIEEKLSKKNDQVTDILKKVNTYKISLKEKNNGIRHVTTTLHNESLEQNHPKIINLKKEEKKIPVCEGDLRLLISKL